jgi:hypothetical protein
MGGDSKCGKYCMESSELLKRSGGTKQAIKILKERKRKKKMIRIKE